MLFGEYTVVKGSRALALPYPEYKAAWSFAQHEKQATSNASLNVFYTYVNRLHQEQNNLCKIDLERFQQDIKAGLWLDSNIPNGYGLGSSGSLCAAVYDRYAINTISNKDLAQLKSIFAQLESCFHGASSGADPLVCYLNQPVLMGQEELKIVNLPAMSSGNGTVFLLNTRLARKTEPLVNIFLKKCENPDFERLCSDKLSQYSDAAMEAFLSNSPDLHHHVRQISTFQYEHFQPMIPEAFRPIWKHGLINHQFSLKLCGAGGGGFILGFARNYEAALSFLKAYKLEVVFEL